MRTFADKELEWEEGGKASLTLLCPKNKSQCGNMLFSLRTHTRNRTIRANREEGGWWVNCAFIVQDGSYFFFTSLVRLQTAGWMKQAEQVSFNHTNPGLSMLLFLLCLLPKCWCWCKCWKSLSARGLIPIGLLHFQPKFKTLFLDTLNPQSLSSWILDAIPRTPNGKFYYEHRWTSLTTIAFASHTWRKIISKTKLNGLWRQGVPFTVQSTFAYVWQFL
jgi:hypothetical protein